MRFQRIRRHWLPGLLGLSVAAAAGIALSPGAYIAAQPSPEATPSTATEAPQGHAVAQAHQLGEAFATVAESVSPAVVSLRVEAHRPQQRLPFRGMPLPMPHGGDDGGIMQGGGSGVIIRPDGYILTNNHVVQNATRIEARLRDGRAYPGEVVGTDPATDLAVVKVDATGLPTARLASSDDARVGEWVVAIGSPFGLDYTVTTGVLSAKGRGGLGANEIEDYLQTDASINPGNSGGPLVNLRGEVLGINTMIVGRGTGIGMAIPSDMARHVANQLIESGQVQRAWIGVSFQELTPELASHFGTQHRTGALIAQVVPGGPAERAGLRAGDIVIGVAGEPVREGRDLLRHVLRQRVGSRVVLDVRRDGQERQFALVATERPGADGEVSERPSRPDTSERHTGGAGLSLQPLNPQIRRQLGYEGDGKVVVSRVADGSPADRAGMRRGDVIVAADGAEVKSPGQIATALGDDGQALLRVERGSGAYFTVLRTGS